MVVISDPEDIRRFFEQMKKDEHDEKRIAYLKHCSEMYKKYKFA